MAPWPLAERPQVREDVARDAAALVRHADDDVLWRLAHSDLDRGRRAWRAGPAFLLLDDRLDGVAKELADDILQVVKDERKGGVQVALEPDLRQDRGRSVCSGCQGLYLLTTPGDDLVGVAPEEDLADEL